MVFIDNGILKLENISYKYPESEVGILSNLNLEIEKEKWTSIIGKNGSGKSTIAKIMDLLIKPNEGQIFLNNQKVNEKNVNKLRMDIGIVFQNPEDQVVGSTVETDVAFGLENRNINSKTMKKSVMQALEEVDMLEFKDKSSQSLSGGQKQRVAIAGIIAMNPNIIILDESTSMLDPAAKKDILKLIWKLKKIHHWTVISITHDVEEYLISDKIIVIDHGEKVFENNPQNLFSNQKIIDDFNIELPFFQYLNKKMKVNNYPKFLDEDEMIRWINQ